MRPIKQLVYLAGVGGALDCSYAIPPTHLIHHTHTHSLCLRRETSFPSLSPARTRSMKNGCHLKMIAENERRGEEKKCRGEGGWCWEGKIGGNSCQIRCGLREYWSVCRGLLISLSSTRQMAANRKSSARLLPEDGNLPFFFFSSCFSPPLSVFPSLLHVLYPSLNQHQLLKNW